MIAIPNMKLPPWCGKCMLQDGEICYAINENDIGSGLSFFDLEDLRNFCIKRRDDCPLIEIDLVRCGECKWYEPRHIEENGIECAGQCIWHIGLKTYCDAHDRENPEDRPRMIIFREPTDFCSYGERRE